MPAPSSSLSTLRPDLAESFTEFSLEENKRGFIANQVLGPIDVDRQAGNFGRIPLDQLLQNRDTMRAPGSGYSRGTFTFKPDTYACIEYGTEEPVDDRESQMFADYFVSEQIAAVRAYAAVLQNQEKRAASLLFDTSTWTGGLTSAAVAVWSNYASATPITDVETAVQGVFNNSGLWPNCLILSRLAFRHLRNCAQVVDRLKYSGYNDPKARAITLQVIADVFDVEQIIVAGSAKNSATEGQTATVATIWDKTMAMVAKVATSQDPKEPCVSRLFHYTEDGSQIGGTVETYRDETIRGNVVRVRHDVQEKLMYKQAGYLLTSVL